jgi:hypothetical protein
MNQSKENNTAILNDETIKIFQYITRRGSVIGCSTSCLRLL